MNILRHLWDYRDDYYFATIGDIEINIRAYSESEFSLWIYEYSSDEELVDAYYKDMHDLEKELNETIGAKVIVPTVESLLKVTRGERNV